MDNFFFNERIYQTISRISTKTSFTKKNNVQLLLLPILIPEFSNNWDINHLNMPHMLR